MTALLDINVLIALLDRDHVHHLPATRFFKNIGPAGWATCPLTENGVLRILGAMLSRSGQGSPQVVRSQLALYLASPGHQFWPDDISLMNSALIPALPSSNRLTDIYLLALAVQHGGRLATFDSTMDPKLVRGGPAAYHLIPT